MVIKIANIFFDIISLYRNDFTASLHIRAMASLLGTSHVTPILHLKNLETQKSGVSI
jgi:hypothetical protein